MKERLRAARTMLRRIRKLFSRSAPRSTETPPLEDGRATEERPPVHRGPRIEHRPIPLSDIDPDAVKIVRRLTRFNHTAYLVGGCVRDLLLDRRPKDFDIGTTATPRQVKRLFSNCRVIGKRFRLAHVYFQNGKIIEVATFRARDIEDEPGNGEPDQGLLIRDDNVFGTPEEDALRRDFTINALFYDVNDGNVIDHADGLGDLRRRVVRTIGDPEIRFREDPIRILRAIKFAARLDFAIEAKTLTALRATRNLIPKAASPRILEEINRFCRGAAARRSFELLREVGIFEVVLPDFAEGYQEDPSSWDALLILLDSMDRRCVAGEPPSTGEILAVLLLPLLARKMGWQEDGVVQRRSGVDIRQLADDFLRPMALRLRVARREQEHARQILMTLHRMVPAKSLRRSTRQSILRRPCTPDCLWILETTADRLGGDIAAALDYWRKALSGGKRAETRSDKPRGADERARRRKRGGRRRGTRRPLKAQTETAQKQPSGAEAGSTKPLPPPWDDSYFFAALPSVPETGEEGAPAKGRSADTNETPKEKRPRPRRRRRKRRPSSEPAATPEPAES